MTTEKFQSKVSLSQVLASVGGVLVGDGKGKVRRTRQRNKTNGKSAKRERAPRFDWRETIEAVEL